MPKAPYPVLRPFGTLGKNVPNPRLLAWQAHFNDCDDCTEGLSMEFPTISVDVVASFMCEEGRPLFRAAAVEPDTIPPSSPPQED